jgi:hypothetical protein
LEAAAKLVEQVGAPNLKLAPSLALLTGSSAQPAGTLRSWSDKIGLWLVSGARRDLAGQLWDAHAPLHQAAALEQGRSWLTLTPAVPLALDAHYAGPDEEFLDAVALAELAQALAH